MIDGAPQPKMHHYLKTMEIHNTKLRYCILETKGRFTLWTMKSDHGRGSISIVRVHGPISMVRLLKKKFFESLGPLTRCKLNVHQEE